MKKIVLAMLLVAAVTAVAQTAPAPAQAPPQPNAAPAAAAPQQSAAPAPAPQKKEIKDPAEYNAYVGAVQQTDANAKVSGLEAFVTQYPNSVMKEDALEALMIAYQQTGNQAKMIDTAQKVLGVNPCNLRALAVLAFVKRAMAEQNQNPQQNFADSGQSAEKGLQCLPTAVKPEGTTPAEWDKLKAQTSQIFNGAAGTAALLQAKDYAKAQKYLRAEVEADPTSLVEVYHLALAYLAPGPTENDLNGLFFIARAANLQTSAAGRDAIAKFGKSKYVKYHGSEDGWTALQAQTATTTLPPADFAITKYVPPTPAEQAAALIKSKKIEEMSFAEWQMVLSDGTPEDAQKVWGVLKGKPLQMVAHVISIDASGKNPTKLMLAGSSDDIDAKRADIDLTMSAAIPAKDMPKEDTDFQFQGAPASYVPKPFVMTMTDGALLVAAKPKPPVHKKPAPH
jgi:tetratricopeptide (TPR) repeat protein